MNFRNAIKIAVGALVLACVTTAATPASAQYNYFLQTSNQPSNNGLVYENFMGNYGTTYTTQFRRFATGIAGVGTEPQYTNVAQPPVGVTSNDGLRNEYCIFVTPSSNPNPYHVFVIAPSTNQNNVYKDIVFGTYLQSNAIAINVANSLPDVSISLRQVLAWNGSVPVLGSAIYGSLSTGSGPWATTDHFSSLPSDTEYQVNISSSDPYSLSQTSYVWTTH